MSENETISPWADDAKLPSPDGRFLAIYRNGSEICMGGPTRGELHVVTQDGVDRLITDDAAASCVWSDDSRFLAFSKWRSNQRQSLCVLELSDMTVDKLQGEFQVLELRSFSDGRITGIDSPVYMPKTFSLIYDGSKHPIKPDALREKQGPKRDRRIE